MPEVIIPQGDALDVDARSQNYNWPVPAVGNRMVYDCPRIRVTFENIDTLLYSVDQTLSNKAPLDSPAFTDNPTAPTQAASANNTSLANTAHVKLAMALLNWSAQSVDFNAEVGRKYLVMATISVYLPDSAVDGDTIVFNKIATANPIIRTTNGKLIYVRDQSDIAVTYNYPTTLTVVYNGTNWEMTAG